MPSENPGAYDEARKRIRETKESEAVIIEKKKEGFEKEKTILRSKKALDVFELKRRIETGHSLESLKADILNALKEGNISFETYEKTLRNLTETDDATREKEYQDLSYDQISVPFDQNKLAKYLEEKKWGENPLVDLLGLMYGFFIQGSAILVILLWRLLIDLLNLPKDLRAQFKKS